MSIATDKLSVAQTSALHALLTGGPVYVDNKGRTVPGSVNARTVASLIARGLARVNGASRVMLAPNGRTGRRIVLTTAGRAALGA